MIEFLLTSHGLAILTIVVMVVFLQFFFYIENKRNRNIFLRIFPIDVKKETKIKKDGNNVEGLETMHKNTIWDIIIVSINKYLSNNKGSVSDYHLIKDIVDRNCDANEEDISTQIPVPLYLGLAGTMAGILIGVAFLVFSGSLRNLLGNETGDSADGIEALLGGVALAMISSIVGISLSTRGALRVKTEKVIVERNKNEFLSWVQAELLPELSSDTAKVIRRMTQNLSNFNKDFAENNAQFTTSLTKVSDTSAKQAELITLISQLQDKRITTKNLELLNVLEKWITNLHNIKEYNDFFGNKIIEVSNYFKAEREHLEQRKTLLAETFNIADSNSRSALDGFNNTLNTSLKNLQETFEINISEVDKTLKLQQQTIKNALDNQNNALLQSIKDQQKAVSDKLQSTSKFVEELNKIGDKIESIERLEQAMKEQNGKFSELIRAINELAKVKVGERPMPPTPKWIKLGGIGLGILISFTCLAILVPLLIKWFSYLIDLLF